MTQSRIFMVFLLLSGIAACSHPSAGGNGTGGQPPGNGTGGTQTPAGSGGAFAGTGGAFAGTGGTTVVDAPVDDVPPADDAGGDVAGADQSEPDDGGGDAGVDQSTTDDGGFPTGGLIGSCVPLNWIVSASSAGPADQVGYAVDDVAATRWSTGAPQSPGLTYTIDFAGYVRISQLRLDSGGSPGDFPRGFEVGASVNGFDFSNVIATVTPGAVAPADNLITVDFPPVVVSALRIQLTGTSGSWWSVHGLSVDCQIPDGHGGLTTGIPPDNLRCQADGGAPAPGTGPFDRANWTVSASNTSIFPDHVIANAIDGNAATRWSSGLAQAPGQFFKVDLGSQGCVGRIAMTSIGTDFIAGYEVAISTDDVTYQTVAKGTGALTTTILVPPHNGRYVRISETGNSGSWWSINELTIGP